MGDTLQQYTFNRSTPASEQPPSLTTAINESKQTNRCLVCNKQLGLLPFTCKCGALTCGRHKWPEHDCTYDYRAEALDRLKKDNPVVVADKLIRI
ncbi:hypothetical protein LCGC14_0945690 [marine sediment metagenome]|uniref:AN1-type domain-containing protein n=1 Tax=marine sediment metagenome TaxID=412755 RepID=A0A0F9NNH2_9ZZZZ